MGTTDATTQGSPAGAPDAALCTITDSRYLLAVYTLIASLRARGMGEPVCVLGVNLTAAERDLLCQFSDVSVAEADPTHGRNPTTRKGEALVATAERYPAATHLTLLDGDCVATGPLGSAFRPAGSGLFGRMKSPGEDAMVFRSRYEPGEPAGGIPRRVLETWRRDVGERDEPRFANTFTGGNLTISRDALPFVRRWQEQMNRVLPPQDLGSHDPSIYAYSQLDESVLNSLLAFAHEIPAIGRHLLDQDPKAYLAHLGPGKPRPWELWRWDRVQYYPLVLHALAWARSNGIATPRLPWTYKRWTMPTVYAAAAAEGVARRGWHTWKRLRRAG